MLLISAVCRVRAAPLPPAQLSFAGVFLLSPEDMHDEDDRQLVDFIWDRRRETWLHLRRFEDVVQRQFEELRMSLVAHAHHAQVSGAQRAALSSPRGGDDGVGVHATPSPALR